MNENNEYDKNNDEFDKWDLILANTFVGLLIIGLIVAGFVLYAMTN